MDRRQIEVAFDELEANNPLEKATVFVGVTKNGGGVIDLTVRSGAYDLFLEDELLVVRYEYREGDVMPFTRTPNVRHFGVTFIPFGQIKMIELESKPEVME